MLHVRITYKTEECAFHILVLDRHVQVVSRAYYRFAQVENAIYHDTARNSGERLLPAVYRLLRKSWASLYNILMISSQKYDRR